LLSDRESSRFKEYIVPAMPRMSKKIEKIAFSILGKPSNYQDYETEKQKEVRRVLDFQDTFAGRRQS